MRVGVPAARAPPSLASTAAMRATCKAAEQVVSFLATPPPRTQDPAPPQPHPLPPAPLPQHQGWTARTEHLGMPPSQQAPAAAPAAAAAAAAAASPPPLPGTWPSAVAKQPARRAGASTTPTPSQSQLPNTQSYDQPERLTLGGPPSRAPPLPVPRLQGTHTLPPPLPPLTQPLSPPPPSPPPPPPPLLPLPQLTPRSPGLNAPSACTTGLAVGEGAATAHGHSPSLPDVSGPGYDKPGFMSYCPANAKLAPVQTGVSAYLSNAAAARPAAGLQLALPTPSVTRFAGAERVLVGVSRPPPGCPDYVTATLLRKFGRKLVDPD
ncbi:hypothetical protein V8C86DRAFT_38447 [Haematococcus lacustris]